MLKRTLLIWTVRLVLALVFVVSVATILFGVFLTTYGMLGSDSPIILCQFSGADGRAYTAFQSEGSTTVGSSVGIYEGHDDESAEFHWWVYETGQVSEVGTAGELIVLIVRSVKHDKLRSDTLVIDPTKESDYVLSTDSLSGPLTIICNLAPD